MIFIILHFWTHLNKKNYENDIWRKVFSGNYILIISVGGNSKTENLCHG